MNFLRRLKEKPANWLVVIFVVIFLFGAYAVMNKADAAEHAATIGLGNCAIESRCDWITQEIGYLYDDRWYVRFARTGNDPTLPTTERYSAGYRVSWRDDRAVSPMLEFGFAYYAESPDRVVAENLTYDMSVGVRLWQVAELVWNHNSTAGRADPNSGIDIIQLRAILRF